MCSHGKYLSNPPSKSTFVPPAKLPNVTTFYDPGDLESKDKRGYIIDLVMMHLEHKYQVFISKCSYMHDKNLSNPKITVCATLKVPNVKFFNAPGDFKEGQGQTYDRHAK